MSSPSSKFLLETVTSVHHWNDTLFSFRTTRDAGLRFENGRWVFVDKVFNDFQETPPFPVPVLNGRGKDILGKDVKSKKN